MDRAADKSARLRRKRPDSAGPPSDHLPNTHAEIRDLLPFVLNQNWQFDWIDGKVEALTGYSPDSFTDGGLTLLDIVHGNDRQAVRRAFEAGLQADRYFQADFRILSKEGKEKWLSMRGPVVATDAGSAASIWGVISDITAHKETEMALERERRIFASAVDNLEDGIYILSEDSEIRFMNQALIDLINDHMGEESYEEVFQRENLFLRLVNAANTDESCDFEEIQIPTLGRTFHVRTFPIYGRDGLIGRLGQLKDITKIRKLERKLRDASLRTRAIAKAANMAQLGIFIVEDEEEMEARFRFANKAFCRLTGYEEQELRNMGFADLTHPDDMPAVMDRYRRRLGGEVFNDAYELQMVRKEGTPITVLFMGARTRHAGKTATVGFLRDITVRTELQKSLELSQRLASIGKLSAEIAHEINNPLTSILTFNNLIDKILEQQPFPTHRINELRDYVGYANAEAKRCAEISRNLLDFSRNQEIVVKEHDIHEILEKTLDILRHRAELSGIRIVTSYAENLPGLICDFHRIQQVFINLIWNAIEAMPQSGVLAITTDLEMGPRCHHASEEGRALVKITVSDTGVGIPRENLDRIFEPFFSTKSKKSGVGLGLSVAYGIIKKHNGDIRVQSRVDDGTCFTVLLPAEMCPNCATDGG